MSGSVNKVILIGNVGRNPEIRTSADGKKIANFSLATSETYKDKTGQKQEKTEWTNVAVFNSGLVDLVERYVSKGSRIFVDGSLRTRKWTDKSGIERYTTEVVLSGYNCNLFLLDATEKGKIAKDDSDGWDNSPKASEDFNDEIPFS